uniref:Glucuronosyltransferase n=1 Tax=Ascaris lumbricoides TaxID=6252 RepID=A0A0M3HLH4_ASCLU
FSIQSRQNSPSASSFFADFITNERLLSELRSVSYDIAITEVYDYCPIGLFHMLDIRTTVLVSAVPVTDFHADVFGLPTPLAYTSSKAFYQK